MSIQQNHVYEIRGRHTYFETTLGRPLAARRPGRKTRLPR